MKDISLEYLRDLMDFEQIVVLGEDGESFKTEGERVYLGRFDQNFIYDENLAY